MLDNLRGTHEGKKIAILGSAPSLLDYFERREEVIIGVNGASQLLEDGDTFLSGDEIAFFRTWFHSEKKLVYIVRPHSAIYSSKLYPDQEVREGLVKEYEKYMDDHSEDVFYKLDVRTLPTLPVPLEFTNHFFHERVPDPVLPHIILRDVSFGEEPLSPNQNLINVGGSSACMALQIAYVMGSNELHLYGVEFSNLVDEGKAYTGGNYFYKPKERETGMTLPSQIEYMDKIIRELRNQNVEIFSHGPTKLKNCSKIFV